MLPGPASAVFLRECTWVCVHACACVHALWWGKAVERGWALVLNDVLGALIKYIIIATNPLAWVI